MTTTRAPQRWIDLAPLKEGLALVWESGRGWTLLQLALLILQSCIPLLALYLTKLVVDVVAAALTGGTQQPGRVTLLIGLVGGVAIVAVVLRALSSLVTEGQALRLGDRVQDALHAKSVEVDLQFYESPEYHDTLHRAQREAPFRPMRIVTELAQVIQGGLSLLAVTGLLFSFHWLLVVALLVTALPGVLVKARFSNRLYQWTTRKTPTERLLRYLNHMLTTIESAKEIRLFGLGEVFRARHRDLRRSITGERLGLVARRSVAEVLAQMVAIAAVTGSMLVIARRALAGGVTIGDMVMYFAAFQRAQDFFREMLTGMAGLYEDNLFLGDFKKFIELPPAVLDPPRPQPFPRPLKRGIEFDSVSFRYPGTEPFALKNVSFEIRPGEQVALVGENGSGKTTLVKLLCRLYDPTEGAIRIGGIDLRDLALADLRSQLAVVFQDYTRYQLSARDNIWVGNVLLPPDTPRVEEAARRTGADGIIQSLRYGYDTMLGRQFEQGAELSLGQWQKLALARAFLRESPILVLDEPTAALDPRSEAEVFAQFQQLAIGRMAILISHRLSTVRNTDRIIVMMDGAIAESGGHDQLLEQAGLYAQLYETQARSYR